MIKKNNIPPKNKPIYSEVEKEILGKNNKALIIEENESGKSKSKSANRVNNKNKKRNSQNKKPSIKFLVKMKNMSFIFT